MLFFLQGNTSKKNCADTTTQRKEIIFSTKFTDDNVMSMVNALEGSNTSCSKFHSELHVRPLDCPGPLLNMLLCKLIRNMSSYHNLLAYVSQSSKDFFFIIIIFLVAAGCHKDAMVSKKRSTWGGEERGYVKIMKENCQERMVDLN